MSRQRNWVAPRSLRLKSGNERSFHNLNFMRIWLEKPLFEGWSWFKFNYLLLELGITLNFYTIVVKGLKLKFRKFWGIILMFKEVTEEKLVWRFWPLILKRVKWHPLWLVVHIYSIQIKNLTKKTKRLI